MSDTENGSGDSEWFIHRLECSDCGSVTRADRIVDCYQCGSEMDHVEKIGEVVDNADTGTNQ